MKTSNEVKNHIPKIKALHRAIESTLFTIHPVLTYPRLIDAIDLLARLVHDYPSNPDSENWELWSIGEFSAYSLDSLIIGAYWHFSRWHNGQNSPEYRALSNLGEVFSPGMSSEPSRGEPEFDVYLALDAMARRSAGLPVYRFVTLEIGV